MASKKMTKDLSLL